MENNSSSFFSDDLKLDYQDQAYLTETSKWARFLSIVGMIMSAITMLIVPVALIALRGTSQALPFGSFLAGGFLMSLFYVLIGGFFFYLSLIMFKFSKYLKSSIDNRNQSELTEALRNQNLYYKILGILSAVYLGFLALALVFGILSAIFISSNL